tara:strand:+ start:10633 stop:11091 length:459 start_codon:yes stop_codon:yes gene_type:complete
LKNSISLIAIIIMASFLTSNEVSAIDLSKFRWKNRVIISFISENGYSESYQQSKYRYLALNDWNERDLVLIELSPKNIIKINGVTNNSINSDNLRNYFSVENYSYLSILLGKDGNEKLRSQKAINNETIFKLIDSMPMRKQEIKNQKFNLLK